MTYLNAKNFLIFSFNFTHLKTYFQCETSFNDIALIMVKKKEKKLKQWHICGD